METALIVSSTDAGVKALFDLMGDLRLHDIQFAMNGGEARRRLAGQGYDLAVVNTPLRDEFGTHLAQHFAEQSGAGILLLVKPEYYSDVSAQVTPCCVLTLPKPTSPQMMLQCMELLCGTRERLRRMEQKSASMEEKMAEIRLVNRAKWTLIEKQGMSEQDAHRYIEKQAMDRCVPKRVVAEEILR